MKLRSRIILPCLIISFFVTITGSFGSSLAMLEGFIVELPQTHPKNLSCLAELSAQITRAVKAVPTDQLQIIRKANFRFKVEIDSAVSDRGAIYIPASDVAEIKVIDHARYSNSIVVPNCDRFSKWALTQKHLVLHEFAHVYLVQLVMQKNFSIPEALEKAYRKAKLSGKYEQVLHVSGGYVQAYAIANVPEYFAEGTEAFLAENDFYPFRRSDLKQFDPDLYKILEKTWK